MHLQATASRAATLLARNPALFCRVMLAKLNTARPMPPLPVRRRIGKIVFEYDLADYRGTAPMYFGSYALLVVNAMQKFLRPGDVFLDVGANIGYLSAVAAGLVGPQGQVHAFEPVPAFFARLCRLAALNPEYRIAANPCAAGESPRTSKMYVACEPGQSTLVPLYKVEPEIASTIEVPVIRLDSYLEQNQIERVALIKIDTEGFELPILRGLQNYFEKSRHRPAIICEIAPRAYPLMGRSVSELAAFMAKYGYSARDLVDAATPVDLGAMNQVEDVLFLAGNR
jgi:FkbM family methyltransferase